MKHFLYIFLIGLFLGIFSTSVYAGDSIPESDLQELVVVNDRSWIENGIYNIIPSKKEKQLSNSPGSLIDVLNIPLLKGEGDRITTMADEQVSIFINGEPANDIDLATFYTSDVKKVEYMQAPSDPRFRGAMNVVNFVMTEYVAGGVTRANARHTLPLTNGSYELASKLIYKRMTYGFSTSANSFQQNKNSREEYKTTYKDIYYNGEKYDEIISAQTAEKDGGRWNTNVAVNARYEADRLTATHTIGLRWDNTPGDIVKSSMIWSENLFNSNFSESFNKSNLLSPSVSGDYYWVISNKFWITGGWKYSFSHNKRFMQSQMGGTAKVENDIEERVNALPAVLNLSFKPDNKWTLFLSANPKTYWYSTHYQGSTDTHSRQFREDLNIYLTAYWQPSRNTLFSLAPGFLYSHYKIDGMVDNTFLPTCQFTGMWNPSRKLRMNGLIFFFNNPVSSSASNPVLYRKDELSWVMGDSGLKNGSEWNANFTLAYMPTDWLSITPNVGYRTRNNDVYTYEEAAPAEMGGVIYTQRNTGRFNELKANVRVNFSLFHHKLSVDLYQQYVLQKTETGFYRSCHNWQSIPSVSYIIGNFRLKAQYRGKRKILVNDAGEGILRQPDNLSFGVSYGWKDLYVYCGVNDILHKKYETSSFYYSDVIMSENRSWTTGRRFELNLTYTFGYGKRTETDIDISIPEAAPSSIL